MFCNVFAYHLFSHLTFCLCLHFLVGKVNLSTFPSWSLLVGSDQIKCHALSLVQFCLFSVSNLKLLFCRLLICFIWLAIYCQCKSCFLFFFFFLSLQIIFICSFKRQELSMAVLRLTVWGFSTAMARTREREEKHLGCKI